MLELSYKDFKAAIIKVLQQTIMNSLKANEKNRKSHQINRTYKKKPMEIIKMKNLTTNKNLQDKLSRGMEMTEDGIRELENSSNRIYLI